MEDSEPTMIQVIQDDVPPELWGMVFGYLSLADRRNVTLTCSFFRLIEQPSFFEVMNFSIVKITVTTRRQPSETKFLLRKPLRSSLERLRFYAGARIASAVKKCQLEIGFPESGGVEKMADGGLEVVAELFQLLPTFPDLSALSFAGIDLDRQKLQRIHEMPALRSLALRECRILPDATSLRPLSIEKLLVEGRKELIHITERKQHNRLGLSTFFDTNRLRTLDISMANEALFSLWSLPSGTRFSSLTSLSISSSVTTSKSFIALLNTVPLLEHLRLSRYLASKLSRGKLSPTNQFTSLPPSLVTQLKSFTGPPMFAKIFACRPLQRIEITWPTPGANPRIDLYPILTSIRFPEKVKYLTFESSDLTEKLVDCPVVFSESLRSLVVTVWTEGGRGYPEDVYCREKLIHKLPLRLPTKLSHFELHVAFTFQDDWKTPLDELLTFKNLLLQRCPGMMNVVFSSRFYAYLWPPTKTWMWHRERISDSFGSWSCVER
ncbi:hypothetical protein JAAARDRAFT_208691 [Jaapia argillacea MUCL 33604]|uniref:F-box domain-containing protein n=1 Tax=Jaapia argillacea MUCL 33604 TaxID=933084 RepID=A0A067PKE8_9AGAM|nr:hypothetical protein JAAARDRAFT_208691 [Jaapia argillacea MUCL 33604]